MSAKPPRMTDSLSPPAAVRWLMLLLAFSACGVTGYLLQVSLKGRGLPRGCGAGSGCAEVLTSRWSAVAGIPVSGPALILYVTMLAAACCLHPRCSPGQRRAAWGVLVLLSAAAVTGAIWFIILQVFVIRAVCPWCMADHVLGLSLAGIVFWQTPLMRKGSQLDFASHRTDEIRGTAVPLLPMEAARARLGMYCLILGGSLFAGGVIGAQLLLEYHPPPMQRLPAGKNSDTGPGPDRLISVLDGRLQIAPREEPMLGSPDAPKLLVMLFDYCCPHCRAAHNYLIPGLSRYQDQIGVVLLPMPLDSKCNPTVDETEPRFEHACELARLALAVWKAKPDAFKAFDAWLFESESPRDPAQARSRAEELVSPSALAEALKSPWIDAQIARHVEAYRQIGTERIPVMMSPGFPSLVGRPESEEQLFEVLEKELGLRGNGR